MSRLKILYIYSASISLALPRLAVYAALPPSLRSAVPLCAQTCVEDFLQREYSSSTCPDTNNLDCLCSRYGVDGYTVGEGLYACLYSSNCPQTSKANGTSLYSLCAGQINAVTATHKTIVVTATPPVETSTLRSSSRSTAQITMTTTGSSSGSAGTDSSFQPSESSRGVMSMNVSLTMAQIAGITIAAAAVLILTVGIATCLIFVRRNRRMQDMDDHKILLYSSPKPPGSQGSQFIRPLKDPRGGLGGVGMIKGPLPPPPEPPIQAPTWPRYYPIMPTDIGIGIATTANYPLQAPSRGVSTASSNPQQSNTQLPPPHLERQSTGVILPQVPVAAHMEPPKAAPPVANKQNKRASVFRPMSSMTEFEEDDPLSPARSTFATLQPSNRLSHVGPQTRQDRSMPAFPAPPSSTRPKNSRLPALSLQIPTFESSLPPPPPNPPVQPPPQESQPMQRPLLLREDQPSLESRNLGLNSTSDLDLRNSSYSSAIASSQAIRSDSVGTIAGRSSSRSNRPPSRSGRDSQASFTSFESSEDEDEEEITPPKEEDRRLSPVQESSNVDSPASKIKYPKVPRAANQVVPRTPASPKQSQAEGGSSSTQSSPRRDQSPAPVSQSIGNRLWKTELSPKSKNPQYPTWNDRQGQENWSWGSEQSKNVTPTQGRRTPAPLQLGERRTQTPPNSIPIPPYSPFGIGTMPKLTPTRRGEDLYLSVNR
jgi:hypothetical protein